MCLDAQYAFLAEAYEEDDVLGNEFMTRKQRVEEEEKPKQGNSRYELMRGWGSWTGPGISEENETERMDRYFLIFLVIVCSSTPHFHCSKNT